MIFQYSNSKIYYEIEGKGPNLLLLHGFLESSSIWKNIVPKVKDKFTTIILDLPGHGKSESISENHTMESQAAVVRALLDSLNFENVILLGHSMGGYVALAFTELYELRVSKLILLNSTTKADTPERKLNRNRAIKLLQKEKNSFIGMAISNLFSIKSKSLFKNEIELLKKEAQSFSTQGIIANLKGMRDREDRTIILSKFNKEKWILCSDEDPLISLNTSESIAKQTETPIKILHGSHMSWLENESEIVNFLHLID